MAEAKKENKRQTYVTLFDILYVVVVVFLVIQPSFEEYQSTREAMGQLKQCRSNIEEIYKAIEAYQKQHNGNVPKKLSDLKVSADGTLPMCPACAALKRSNSYEDKGYEFVQKTSYSAAVYTVCCRGGNHFALDIPKNQPYYSSSKGLHPSDYELIKFDKK